MVKKRRLGKGLDALLGTPFESTKQKSGHALETLSVDLLQRGTFQPRKEFNQVVLQELADSIKAQGLVQPIVVRPIAESRQYEIIAGERRWRAAQLAGLHAVPAIIKDVPDKMVMCISLIENIQREDLNPLEEAQALNRLLHEFDMTHDAIAEAVGRSRSSVSNLLRLLDLDDEVKKMLDKRQISMGHARALLTLPPMMQYSASLKIVKQDLSVRATEALVRQLIDNRSQKKSIRRPIDPDVRSLQDELTDKLATKVAIKYNKSGKGELTIHYSSFAQLDGILKRIK